MTLKRERRMDFVTCDGNWAHNGIEGPFLGEGGALPRFWAITACRLQLAGLSSVRDQGLCHQSGYSDAMMTEG